MDKSEQNSSNILTPLDPRQARKLVCLSGDCQTIYDKILSLLTRLPQSDQHTNAYDPHYPLADRPLLWVGSMPSSQYRYQLGNRCGLNPSIADQDLILPEQSAVVQHLGTEHSLIVFDATKYFDANAFAAICGTLVHGGRLYLITPPLQQWALQGSQNTPVTSTARFTKDEVIEEWNLPAEDSSQHDYFLERFIRLLRENTLQLTKQAEVDPNPLEHRELVVATDNEVCLKPVDSGPEPITTPLFEIAVEPVSRLTPDQQRLMERLLLETDSLNKQVWLITADRGRGKSALLGLLLAELQTRSDRSSDNLTSEHQRNNEFLISGPSKRATQVLRRHFHDAYGQARSDRSVNAASLLNFCPPDELLASNVKASLLIVDEAAAIPLPMLKKLLRKFPRVILATTVHGYEGAGRGFEIRLAEWLQQPSLGHQWLSLSQPVRWLANDRLESFCNQAFLLNAKIPDFSASISPDSCQIRELSGAELSEDEPLLISVFALLVQAHYQTKPMDLQHLLDGANLRIFVLLSGHHVCGVAWLAAEGPFSDDTLKNAIVRNQRRPHGHLLPQVLSQWTGRSEALDYRLSRIVRLAIHPQLQRQGLGSLFIRQLVSLLDKEAVHIPVAGIGALFAAEPGVVEFWKHNGLQPFHLGAKENKRSGLRSIAMLRSLGDSNFSQLLSYADLLYRCNYNQDIQAIPAYQPNQSTERVVGQRDSRIIDSDRLVQDYIDGYRSFENSKEFIRLQLDHTMISRNRESLNNLEKTLLERSLDNGFSFVEYARVNPLQGKKQAESLYRTILKKVLSGS